MSKEAAWQDIARRKEEQRAAAIPKEWILESRPGANRDHVLDVPRECGILTKQEINITENYDATALVEGLRTKKLKSVDVVTAFCKRAATAQQLTNCLTEILFREAIIRAKELDEHFDKTGQPLGPLHGLPISFKDSFRIVGRDASIGYAALCFKPAEENSTLVDLLLSAGAVVYCKTNIPLTLMALDSHNNVFGRTLNPANLKLTAGGSSGGEGALLAMRGSVLGVGTDVGGSIRIPAMCNGLVGFKPSHGRIPYAGQESGSLEGSEALGIRAVAGPLAHTIRDCALFFKVVGELEPWVMDPECFPQKWDQQLSLTDGEDNTTKTLRVGIVRTDGVATPLPPVQTLMDELARILRTGQNIEVVEMDVSPLFSKCQGLANGIFGIEGANSAFDLLEATSEPLSPWLAARIRRRKALPLDRIRSLHAQRAALQKSFLQVWKSGGGYWKGSGAAEDDKQLDVLICPVAPHPTPAIDTWNTASYTSSFNLLDYPAATLPVRSIRRSDLKGEINTEAKVLSSWDKYNRQLWAGDRSVFLGGTLCVQVVSQCKQEKLLMQALERLQEALKPLAQALDESRQARL